jgi:predicted cobalt transporter CbtA
MRLIKNFLHNINDIVLAIVIVALAAGIIYWRMQIILDYPKQLADQQAVYMEEAEEDAAETEEAAQDEAAAEQTETEQPADSAETPAENAESEEQPQG